MTGNTENFQGRYVLRHAFEGEMKCEAATDYKKMVNERRDKEVKTLANLTGWDRKDIWADIDAAGKGVKFDIKEDDDNKGPTWWKGLWDEE